MRYNPLARSKSLLGLLLAALLVAVSACGGSDDGGDSADSGKKQEQQSSSAPPEPDLEGIPDVVAEVNGTELEKSEFEDAYTPQYQQMAMQSQGSGQGVDEEKLRKQVVENLVNAELLVQEAEKRDFGASQKQVDQELKGLAKQNGMQDTDQFVKALEQQGMDAESVDYQIRKQVKIDQLLAAEGGDTKPSQAELRKLYQQMKAQQEKAGQQGGQGGQQKVPPFKQVKPQLVQQVKSQKQGQVASTIVEDLRKDADIQVHL